MTYFAHVEVWRVDSLDIEAKHTVWDSGFPFLVGKLLYLPVSTALATQHPDSHLFYFSILVNIVKCVKTFSLVKMTGEVKCGPVAFGV